MTFFFEVSVKKHLWFLSSSVFTEVNTSTCLMFRPHLSFARYTYTIFALSRRMVSTKSWITYTKKLKKMRRECLLEGKVTNNILMTISHAHDTCDNALPSFPYVLCNITNFRSETSFFLDKRFFFSSLNDE